MVFTALILVVFVALLVTLVLALVFALGVALIGWLVSLLFPLSPFQGAILGLVAGLGIGAVLFSFILTMPSTFESGDAHETEEEKEEGWSPPVTFQHPMRTPVKSQPSKRKRKARS